ncbi:unnamed protein product [Protopolystoma xenopodis]|uniref:Uncharacterized protein n=1 Tax=Protopolystoma xenopodis TaxID=117903 RepID=A0A448XJD8_9PLAT|nr:unnamed protein product [Protopolystoma xenopodis]
MFFFYSFIFTLTFAFFCLVSESTLSDANYLTIYPSLELNFGPSKLPITPDLSGRHQLSANLAPSPSPNPELVFLSLLSALPSPFELTVTAVQPHQAASIGGHLLQSQRLAQGPGAFKYSTTVTQMSSISTSCLERPVSPMPKLVTLGNGALPNGQIPLPQLASSDLEIYKGKLMRIL